MSSELSFIHRFLPAADSSRARTLLLLHGTGGDENDLLTLGKELDPHANLLSPRGKVLENGMPRFFRRLAEGVFDIDDVKLRTHELADFLQEAAPVYNFDASHVTAVGYSNGANIAASLLLLRPEALAGAVLFRGMLPLKPESVPDLYGKRVLLLNGRTDPFMPVQTVERLAQMLQEAGATVTLLWQPVGHGLTEEDRKKAKEFLRERDVHF